MIVLCLLGIIAAAALAWGLLEFRGTKPLPAPAADSFPAASPMRERPTIGPGWRETSALPPLSAIDQALLRAEIRTLTSASNPKAQATCPSSPEDARGTA